MATLYEVVIGWTEPIDIDLLSKGATPTGSLSGTVALVLRDRHGTQIDTTGDVSIQDADDWVVRYTPDAADLTPGTYTGRVKVTSGSNVSYFPSGEPDKWIVRHET